MITDVRLQQFRSYQDASFEFEPGVNIIVGPNASGKTNLLEALLLLAQGKSYRAKDFDLLSHNKEWARIDGHKDGQHRTVKLQSSPGSKRIAKTFENQGVSKKRLQLADTVPIVLFEPSDLQLLTGSPERRRAFMDTLLSRSYPDFARVLKIYERTLLQRNALLKQGPAHQSELFVWNLRLSEAGGKIAEARVNLATALNKQLSKHYKSVANEQKTINAEYASKTSSTNYGSHMLKQLEASTGQDVARGYTGFGPHRDDLLITFDGKLVSETASRGEVRTMVLGLKMLELSLLEQAREQKPILLLDDVFSELDGARRKALTDFLKDHQTFITTTDADIIIKHFTENCKIVPLNQKDV